MQSPVEAVALAARVERNPLDLLFVLFVFFVFVFFFAFFFLALFVLVFVFVFVAVRVEFLGERHAVTAVIDPDVETEKRLAAETAEAAAAVRVVRPRVVHRALSRSGIVARADARARAPYHPVACAVLEPGAAAGQRVGRARRPGKIAAQPLMRVAVHLVMPADGVDRAADGVARIEQRRRTLDHLEPLELGRVDHFAVVARCRSERAHADAVLHDQHPFAVEAADDRPRRTRAETAIGNPRAHLVIERFAQRDIAGQGQFLGVEGFHVAERFEGGLLLFARGHGDFVPQGGQGKREIDGRRAAGRNLDGLGRLGENAVEMGDDVVAPRGHPVECIRAVVSAQRAAAEFDDQDNGPMQRAAGFLHRNRAAETAVRLRRGRDGRKDHQSGAPREKTDGIRRTHSFYLESCP